MRASAASPPSALPPRPSASFASSSRSTTGSCKSSVFDSKSVFRRRQALDHHIDARRLARCRGAPEGFLQFTGPVDVFAVRAQRLRHGAIASRQKLAALGALASIGAKLDLVLGVPGRIVAEHRDVAEPMAHGGIELGE